MLNLMISDSAVVWIAVTAAVVLAAAALAYYFYRVRIRPRILDGDGEDDIIQDDDEKEYGEISEYDGCKNPEEVSRQVAESADDEKSAEAENITAETVFNETVNEKPAGNNDGETLKEAEGEAAETEILYSNDRGRIEITGGNEGFKFRLVEGGAVIGESDIYQTKQGLLKGLKSLVNYRDTVICEAGGTDEKTVYSRFEIFIDDDGNYGYNLKTKIKTKFSGAGFETKTECIKAIDSVKKIGVNFNI